MLRLLIVLVALGQASSPVLARPDSSPIEPDSLSDQIRSAQNSGDYPRAAKLYLQLIASGTDTPEVRSNCGIMLHLAGQNRQALDQFHIALRRDNSLVSSNLFAGLAEFDLGEFHAALPYLHRARDLDPNRPTPLLALAKTYLALREYSAANDFYSKAAALDASSAEAWFGRGVTGRSMADQLLNKAVRDGRANDPALKQKVQDLLDGAVQTLSRAIELDPNSARTHLLMAESLADQGKQAEAIPEYQAALKLDPTLDAAYLGLASEYWKQRQFDQALPLLQRLLQKSPKDPEANAIMADILEHNGDIAASLRHAQIALAGNPALIQTRIVVARLYLAKKQPKLAIAEIRKVVSADPDGSYHFLLFRACQQAGDEQGAKQAMAEFQQIRYGTPSH